MDVSFSSVVEGTRQYFLGVPAPPPPSAPAPAYWSEPHADLEPAPHIIHKASVVREALQRQRHDERAPAHHYRRPLHPAYSALPPPLPRLYPPRPPDPPPPLRPLANQPRPTVSVTSLVHQMNQRQRRESPLDLSVKTVKHSADSTARDDLDPAPAPAAAPLAPRAPHKVDFSPNFHSQYSPDKSPAPAHAPSAVRRDPAQSYIVDNRYQPGRPRYTTPSGERVVLPTKRPPHHPHPHHLPAKLVRYETWSDDSRIAREQRALLSQPVYSYTHHRHRACFPHAPPPAPLHRQPHSVDERVLSILRSSLETRALAAPPPPRLTATIVIDDDDPPPPPPPVRELHAPRAVDSVLIEADAAHARFNGAREPVAAGVIRPPQRAAPPHASPDAADVASRIRTKAELKGFLCPPPRPESQKAHLFRQIHAEAAVKHERLSPALAPRLTPDLLKSEPINIEAIERDAFSAPPPPPSPLPLPVAPPASSLPAARSVPSEHSELSVSSVSPEPSVSSVPSTTDDFDWSFTCDSFVRQLKTGCARKKTRRKLTDTIGDNTPHKKYGDSIIEVPADEVKKLKELSVDLPSDPFGLTVATIKTEVVEETPTDSTATSNETIKPNVKLELKSVSESVHACRDRTNIETSESTSRDAESNTSLDTRSSTHNGKEKVGGSQERARRSKTEECTERKRGPRRGSGRRLEATPTPEQLHQMEKSVTVEVVDILARVKREPDSSDDDVPLSRSKLLEERRAPCAARRDPTAVFVKLESCADLDRAARARTAPASSRPGCDSDEGPASSRMRGRRAARGGRSATPRGSGFGDGSDFHPGWEEEVYRYKRSLRMPSRLISPWLPARLSSSLPDLDPAPVSPAPSSRAHTAPLDTDRALDSDLDSRLCYDSEASSSTVLSYSTPRTKPVSILDILISKYGRKEELKSKRDKGDASTPAPAPPIDTDAVAAPPARHAASIEEVFGDAARATRTRSRPKHKKVCRDKARGKPASIRDGLRSTSLRKCDARGRLLRLRKRHDRLNKMREATKIKSRAAKRACGEAGVDPVPAAPVKRIKRLFARRKLSSGFDYIRKKKRAGVTPAVAALRRRDPERSAAARKPSPESVHDIHKEIKAWFINKSIGETPLHRAARLGYTDCAAYCLEVLGASPCARDNAGFTPLHVAAARGHLHIARLLLQYGADVSAAAAGGVRPLHEASESDSLECVRLLLAYGADPLLATYSGQTPAALAEQGGPVAQLLRAHLHDVRGDQLEPWRFPPPYTLRPSGGEDFSGCDPLASPPPASPSPPPADFELVCSDMPLPPFYTLRPAPHSRASTDPAGPHADALWCLLQDITSLLQIKSREALLKQVCGGAEAGREVVLVELRTHEFLERAVCQQLLGAGEKVNPRASKVALVRLTAGLRALLHLESSRVLS